MTSKNECNVNIKTDGKKLSCNCENSQNETYDLPLIMTPQQVADFFQVSSRTVLLWFYSGELEGTRLGKRTIRFHRDQVIEMLIKKGKTSGLAKQSIKTKKVQVTS